MPNIRTRATAISSANSRSSVVAAVGSIVVGGLGGRGLALNLVGWPPTRRPRRGYMFDALSDRIDSIFQRLKGRGKLSEELVDEVLREVRLALLEADVHTSVVRAFLARVRERAIGDEVLKALTPVQAVIKIVQQ